MRSVLVALSLWIAPSCSDDHDASTRPSGAPRPAGDDAGSGAGAAAVAVAPDPASGAPDGPGQALRPMVPPVGPHREKRPIDVMLRSSPPGATVAVDGRAIGVTPALWPGLADGREHEFMFLLSGHAMARYRFVPITSGVVHAQLEPITDERGGAAPLPPPEVVPALQPSAIVPPAPPPTIEPAVVEPPAGAAGSSEAPAAGSGSAGSGSSSGPASPSSAVAPGGPGSAPVAPSPAAPAGQPSAPSSGAPR